MIITTHDLKEGLYIAQTFFGFLLVGLAIYLLQSSCGDLEQITSSIAGVILLCVGIFMIFFGLETYILKDDADIWR
ncbi:hypothetical protein BH10CYA1_BH10CYA1_60500 [soil metagenome]